jgi:hypothetical protein
MVTLKKPKLTASNYHSLQMNNMYWSASLCKSFLACEARTMAELRGEYVRAPSDALLIGSYVDAYFEGTLEQFKLDHPEVFKRNGELRAEFSHADTMILRAEMDPVFMEHLEGEKQVIRTGTIDGYPFKIKMDVYHPERIVDLKTTANFLPVYKPGQGRMTFIEAYQYTLQGAIYQAIEGRSKPFYIAAITKEAQPDIAVVRIGQHYLDADMKLLRDNLPYYDAIKQGMIEPPRCEHCAYCKATRKLTGAIELDEFEMIYFEGE